MANEWKLSSSSGTAINAVGILQNSIGQFYNTVAGAFETFNSSNIAKYAAVSFTQIATTSEYLGSMPTGIPAGKYRLVTYLQAGGSLALSDIVGASYQGSDQIEWKGSAELSQAADVNLGISANGTAIAAVPTAVIANIKADATLAKTFSRTMGKFIYNPTTSVMTLLEDDGVTVVGTVTIAAISGVITSRT